MFDILLITPEHAGHPELDAVKTLLESQGYRVETAKNVDTEELRLRAHPPDLILMDTDLPDMRSYQNCRQLKQAPETEHIPVIFYDQKSVSNGEVLKGFESGAYDFISLARPAEEASIRIQAALRTKQSLAQSKALAEQLNQINSELYQRNLQVERELYVARQLQQSLLPPILPNEEAFAPLGNSGKTAEPTAQLSFSKCHYRDDKLRISGVYLPCSALGGDIYDVIQFQNNTIGVAIADVSGHGVPAGFITAIFKSSFYRVTHNHDAPDDILYHLNNELINIVKTGEYVTGIYLRIHEDRQTLDYTGAGHPYPIYYKAVDGTFERLKENGTPLVWVKDMQYPMGKIRLEPGDRLLLFTDGISEMRNTAGELFGEESLESLFTQVIHEEPDRILDAMIERLSDFSGGHPLEDDLSVVLIEAL